MAKGKRLSADSILKQKRRGQRWKRLAGVLGCLVVVCTAYLLMRPAETLERELICGMEEHLHSVEQGCYREVAAEPAQPVCGQEESTGHTHSEVCCSEERVLTCAEPEGDGHQHDENCYTIETTLICSLPETEDHTHTAECYPADSGETRWELVCDMTEHPHTEDCYADDATQHVRVLEAAALIDALPSAEDAEAKLAELLAAKDAAAYQVYREELVQQIEQANTAYDALTDEQKAQLNSDRLTELSAYLTNREGVFTLSAPAMENGVTVSLSGEASLLPYPAEELTLTAAEAEDEDAAALRDQALADDGLTAAESYILDIRLMREGEAVQPLGPIAVTLADLPTEAADTADDAAHMTPVVYQINGDVWQVTEADVALDDEDNVVWQAETLTCLYSISLLPAEFSADDIITYAQETDTAYTLPETGGSGVVWHYAVGAALLVGAAYRMVCRDRRGKAGGRTS